MRQCARQMQRRLAILGFAATITVAVGAQQPIYVIALDEIAPDLALRARHYLRTFIEGHFEPNDVGAVVNLARARSSEAQDFTSDRGLLLATIDKLKGWPPGPDRPKQLLLREQAAGRPLSAATFRYASVEAAVTEER
jgi:hypothetical protein